MLVFVASVAATSVVQPPATPDATPAPAPAVDDTPPHRLAVDLEVGIGFAGTSQISPGPALSLGIDVGYHVDRDTSFGLHLSEASFTGTVTGMSYSYIPISVDGYATERFLDICWGTFLLGAHVDRNTGPGSPGLWTTNLELGLGLGVDIWRWSDQSLGLFALTETEISDTGYVGAIVGVTYRR